MPLIQLVNYAVYPLQIVLLVPFYTAGSWIFGERESMAFGRQMIESFQHDMWGSLAGIWDTALYAILVWLIVSPLTVSLLYKISLPLIKKVHANVEKIQVNRREKITPM